MTKRVTFDEVTDALARVDAALSGVIMINDVCMRLKHTSIRGARSELEHLKVQLTNAANKLMPKVST